MKKILCTLLALCMIAAVTTGCTGKDNPSESGGSSSTTKSSAGSSTDVSNADISSSGETAGSDSSSKGGTNVSTNASSTASVVAAPPDPHKPTIKKLRVQVDGRTVSANNKIGKWLKKNLGFEIELVHIKTVDIGEQLSMMAAANNLPDLFTIQTGQPIYYKLRDDGMLMDIEKLVKDWGSNIVSARGWDQLNSMRDRDGTLRCLANCTESGYDVLMIRQDWLEKLNLKVPTTTEEFRNVMRAFVTRDPDGNGVDDTHGFLSLRGGARGMMALWAAFGATPGDIWHVQDNGKLIYSFLQRDRMVPALKYLRSLREEGLLSDSWTVTGSDYNTLVSSGKVGIVQDNCWYLEKNNAVFTADPTAKWIYIDPPKGPNGYSGYVNYENPKFRARTCISKNCADPIAAMMYLNFLADYDNLLTIRGGLEGIHWKYSASTTSGKEFLEPYASDQTLLFADGVSPTYALPFMAEDPPRADMEKVCIDAYNRRRKLETQWNGVLYEYPESLLARDDLDLQYTWYAWMMVTRMINGSKDIDADYANLFSELKSVYKLDEITKLYQAAYDAGQR